MYESKGPQTLAIPSVDSGLEDLDNDQSASNGLKDLDLNDPMDDEQLNIDMEVEVQEPGRKKKKKAGAKGKKKVTMPKLREEIRAIRKEVPNSEIGHRVQRRFFF